MEQFSELSSHKHTGLDAPRLNPKYFLGFPIFTAAPTHNALEGTIILANESGTYKLYAFINGGWRTTTLT
jgi:hypothetical protein